MQALLVLAEASPSALHQPDENGWLPLHEAVRSGHVDVAQLLIEKGGDINSVTYGDQSPLNIARAYHGEDHVMTQFLIELGAADLGPEL